MAAVMPPLNPPIERPPFDPASPCPSTCANTPTSWLHQTPLGMAVVLWQMVGHR
jgi:hypothetical protein